MKKIFASLAFCFTLSLVFVSCSKDGDTGPAGTSGAAGPAGPAGAAGAVGPAGAVGTANVIYSAWFAPTAWTGSGTTLAYFDKAATGVTQSVIDNGVVLAYTKLVGDNGVIRPLPATPNNTAIWNFHITAVGNLRFTYARTDGTNVNPSAANEFRYVIIPGGVSGKMSTAMSAAAIAELKAKSFEEIAALYNIPESGSKAH